MSESKGESKRDNDYKGSKDDRIVEIDVKDIRIPSERDETLLMSPLDIEVDFNLDCDVNNAQWCLKLLVDCAMSRQIKILGETKITEYNRGSNTFEYSIEHIDLSGFKKSTLANAGLLMMGLEVNGEEIATINLVVDVTKNKEGRLLRTILNPLD